MSSRKFRLMTFLYVTPPTATDIALSDLRDLCTLNDDVKALNPSIRNTSIPGRLRIEFEYSAENLIEAEKIADDSLQTLIIDHTRDDIRDSLTQGSNSLSPA